MASNFNPSFHAVSTIKTSISNALATDLPPEVRAGMIAPLLAQVNQWVNHIPAMVDQNGVPIHANLVFAIRKDLFVAPLFNQCVLGIPLLDLPPPFAEFVNFIHKIIDAQKSDKEKPPVKVRSLQFSILLLKAFIIFSLLDALVELSSLNLQLTTKTTSKLSQAM
jgi:hypothetical protein